MCGIAGIADFSAQDASGLGTIAERMAEVIAHRGPDDSGVWVAPEGQVALAHRRLSVVDLSPAGHQPMESASGRFVLVYNGEIYNYRALAAELSALGQGFRGHSDTEVLLAALEHWGVAGALERSVGMFAFALWDRTERTLTLARDRLGEKPLYWTRRGQVVAFGSEIHALREVPGLALEVDRGALAAYLRHLYIPAPHSVYRDVWKLEPGTFLTLAADRTPAPTHYWHLRDAVRRGRESPFTGSEADATDAVRACLADAVRLQLQADVPVGAFLSGGIDSSTVVALMQSVHSAPVRTFTIGFHEQGYDEAVAARAVAAHLGTDHHELYVSTQDAMAVIPALPQMYSEPFADVSQIPTYLVSKLAREKVTVSLSGDGGDELFGGYHRYAVGQRRWSRIAALPGPLRGLAAAAITALAPESWNRFGRALGPLAPERMRSGQAGQKLHEFAAILRAADPAGLCLDIVSAWKAPATALPGAREAVSPVCSNWPGDADSFFQAMMYVDTLTYLPDDILVKLDRASMAVGLESRVPLLDHRLVELAWSLPSHLKARGGETKIPLRRILGESVPRALWDRPKQGFSVPMADWLRGPLREWAEPLLSAESLESGIGIEPQVVIDTWQRHQSGSDDHHDRLWPILALQAWLTADRG